MDPSPSRHSPPSSSSSSPQNSARRPMLTRQDAESLLSYYHSPEADKGLSLDKGPMHILHQRQYSAGSNSSSDYSTGSGQSEYSSKENLSLVSPVPRRRPSVRMQISSDRRRMAMFEMETPTERSSNSTETDKKKRKKNDPDDIHSRSRLQGSSSGLAVAAPLDSSDIPTSAPPTKHKLTPDSHPSSQERGHHKAASESTGKKTSPRNVAIVGTTLSPHLVVEPPQIYQALASGVEAPSLLTSLKPPLFIHPQSRSSSPSLSTPSPVSSSGNNRLLRRSPDESDPILEIGQEKATSNPASFPAVDLNQTLDGKLLNPSEKEKQPSHSASPSTTSDRSVSFVHYQPGLHSTAGPLPAPPRAALYINPDSSPPPRPPRLHSPSPMRRRGEVEAIKQALQLSPSVSAALTAKGLSPAKESTPTTNSAVRISSAPSNDSGTGDKHSCIANTKSAHRREGAFAPSTETTSPTKSSPCDRLPGMVSNGESPAGNVSAVPQDAANSLSAAAGSDIRSIVVEAPPEQEDMTNGEKGWVSVARELTSSPEGRTSAELSVESTQSVPTSSQRSYRSPPRSPSVGHSGVAPSPPPKSFRNSLTSGFKRMSLPRSPSNTSLTRSMSMGSARKHSHSQSPSKSPLKLPSPPLPPTPLSSKLHLRPAHSRIKNLYPEAMYCHEVHSLRNVQERCMTYAQKINELYLYDCGLTNWIIEAKIRGPNGTRSAVNLTPSLPSNVTFSPQPRHPSNSSEVSEATFPRRPDATTATDLLAKYPRNDVAPKGPPPSLPYPALAQQTRHHGARAAASNGTSSASMRLLQPLSSPKTGFFASLGRKASLSTRKDKPTASGSSSTPARLTKSPPANVAPPRPIINVTSQNPTVPGGPRAPPQRALRSQTVMISSPFASHQLPGNNSAMGRKRSMNDLSSEGDGAGGQDGGRSQGHEQRDKPYADPEFVRQVDKLQDLLPHAERDVLASYLRRAGQDILAIGQYLDDEKNGTIRRD